MNNLFIKNKTLFLLDQDGTLYNGDILFEETIPFLNKIKSNGHKVAYVTNNSSKSVSDYIKKLAAFGIKASKDEFFTSTEATIIHLNTYYKDKSVYPVGTTSFISALREAGIKIEDSNTADIALLAYDSELNYEKLTNITKMLTTRDVVYIATNPDLVCPTPWGSIPDCGSFAKMIQTATGKYPLFIGKPNKSFLDLALQKYGVDKSNAVMIGDRLYTDIQSGINSGIDTILVLTGEATIDDAKAYPGQPTLIVPTLKEIFE